MSERRDGRVRDKVAWGGGGEQCSVSRGSEEQGGM